MGTFLLIVLGLLIYIFLARVTYNIFPKVYNSKQFNTTYKDQYIDTFDDALGDIGSTFFPLLIPFIILMYIAKIPFKLADFVTDPSKYKFRIRLERS